MITFKWQLKSISTKKVIQKGEVKADRQDAALKILNDEWNIHPHTDEILEIISPVRPTKGFENTILT